MSNRNCKKCEVSVESPPPPTYRLLTGRVPFLLPNLQRQSVEIHISVNIEAGKVLFDNQKSDSRSFPQYS